MALSMGTNVWSGWKVKCTIPEEVSRAHSLAGSWRMNLIPSEANILWSIYTAYTGLLSFTTTSLGPEFFTSSTACRQGSELSMVLASRWLAGYTGRAWKQGMRTCPSGKAERATRMPNRSHNSHTIPIKLGVLISAQCFVLLNQSYHHYHSPSLLGGHLAVAKTPWSSMVHSLGLELRKVEKVLSLQKVRTRNYNVLFLLSTLISTSQSGTTCTYYVPFILFHLNQCSHDF